MTAAPRGTRTASVEVEFVCREFAAASYAKNASKLAVAHHRETGHSLIVRNVTILIWPRKWKR